MGMPEIQRTLRGVREQPYAHPLDNPEEREACLETTTAQNRLRRKEEI